MCGGIGSRSSAPQVNLVMADQGSHAGNKLIPQVNQAMAVGGNFPAFTTPRVTGRICPRLGVSSDPASAAPWPGRRMGTGGLPASLAQGNTILMHVRV